MTRNATRESFSRIGETCPHVDEGADNLMSDIQRCVNESVEGCVKEQTNALRAELTTALQELQDERDESSKLREEISDLEKERDDLIAEIREMES